MKRPDEWARVARTLADTYPEAEYPTIYSKLRDLEARFTRASEETSAGSVELGELLNIMGETGLMAPARVVEILDRLWEQRSYAAR